MKKKILITGGAGYIGSTVAHLMIDKGYRVTIVDNLITGNIQIIPKKALFVNCDISDSKKLSKLIKKENFDYLMHFAGLVSVEESMKYPKRYFTCNYEKSKIFFDTCFKNGLTKIIFSSTASVYGKTTNRRVLETDKLNPKNPYAVSKLKIEKYLIQKSKTLPITYVILRYFNVAGAEKKMRTGLVSKYSTHLIKIACEVVVNKRNFLKINGDNYNTKDGTPVRDYIHISDLAEIHYLVGESIVKNNLSKIYNCGYGSGYSVKEVVNVLNKILKYKLPIVIGPRRKGDLEYVVSNSKKFQKEYSWKPKYNDLSFILKSSIKWEKKLKDYFKI